MAAMANTTMVVSKDTVLAHKAGVNCITIDKFEGRYLLSGGAESSISLWDLETIRNGSKPGILRSGWWTYELVQPHTRYLAIKARFFRWLGVRSMTISWLSGGSDGTVRLLGYSAQRRLLGVLDMEDSVGVLGEDGLGTKARPLGQGKAHVGTCNGVVWTGRKAPVTTGHDERVRNNLIGLRAAGDVEMYSAHSDGVIRAWKPRTAEEVEADNEEAEGAQEE
ncbi:hypothetical protein G7Y79_00118g101930 [Physcia stellaris]|nr:hypothetical protein G7Y79_00118g101930 [Physcia stellaris]